MKAGPVGGVPGELARRLGFWDSFLLSLGIVIGSGVFLTPHSIARDLPSPGFILAVWVVGGVLSMMGALAIAELGAMRFPPSATSFYDYVNLVGLETRPFPNPLSAATPSTVIELKNRSWYARQIEDLPEQFQRV